MPAAYVIRRRAQMNVRFALTAAPAAAVVRSKAPVRTVAEGAEIAVSSLSAIAVSGRISLLPFIHDLLVRLLDFLEFCLRLIFMRIIDIGIRMIFSAQSAVSFFYLIIRRVSVYS